MEILDAITSNDAAQRSLNFDPVPPLKDAPSPAPVDSNGGGETTGVETNSGATGDDAANEPTRLNVEVLS